MRSEVARYDRAIDVVAVTKGRSLEEVGEAVAAGLAVAENRVQEALPKLAAFPDAEWHLIGHLQSNKVAKAAGRFELIQSVHSLELAERIAARAPAQRVLVQVNAAGEAQKSGCEPEAAVDLCRRVATLLDLRGLMCIGPLGADPRPAFDLLRRLRDEAEQATGRALPILSMGMTDDWRIALERGSTMLRLGRVLFGDKR